ncbi:MAG: hypothetical protein ACLQLC_17175 [Candidatus Sulfotelmatobacter sp.]
MEILTPQTIRRGTRLRVEIPVTMTSLDRRHYFSADCVAVVVSSQGGGIRADRPLPIETPVLLGDLPSGASVSARVVSCVPLGNDGANFIIGVSLYNPGNVWGIANPPADWDCSYKPSSGPGAAQPSSPPSARKSASKTAWPYNLFSAHGEAHPGRK